MSFIAGMKGKSGAGLKKKLCGKAETGRVTCRISTLSSPTLVSGSWPC